MTQTKPAVDGNSFRDPSGTVFVVKDADGSASRVLRAFTGPAAELTARVMNEPFYQSLVSAGKVVDTKWLDETDPGVEQVLSLGWARVAEHPPVNCITYPYEWSFSMLRDAALLQLELLASSVESDWILKDATPYNIQWDGGLSPVFIDVPSFVPRDGDYWRGYRQFCAMFLIPLMITAHLGIPFQPLLRSQMDGISAQEGLKYFHSWGDRLRKGVLPHVVFPAKAETISRARRSSGSYSQSKTRLLALLDSLKRTVERLSYSSWGSDWSRYTQTHSYGDLDYDVKKRFVERHLERRNIDVCWDIGANTGDFSRLVAPHCGVVIALDSDFDSVERCTGVVKAEGVPNVIPMVMDIANPSPNQGWAGHGLASFETRMKPDAILCLAVVHHVRVSMNLPLGMFMDWLRRLNATVIIEFVSREDEMFVSLLANKTERYEDYNLAAFEAEARERFSIVDRRKIKGGQRELFVLEPVS